MGEGEDPMDAEMEMAGYRIRLENLLPEPAGGPPPDLADCYIFLEVGRLSDPCEDPLWFPPDE